MNIKNILIKRGDMFLVDLGNGKVGSEQGGYRPVVCVQNNLANKYSPVMIVAPITSSKTKTNLPTHVDLNREIGIDKDSVCLLEQLITIDKKRLEDPNARYIGRLRGTKLQEINEALECSLGLINTNERPVLAQLEIVKNSEYHLKELIDYKGISKSIIDQAVVKYEYECLKLENICTINRVYMDNYYKKASFKINTHVYEDTRGNIKVAL